MALGNVSFRPIADISAVTKVGWMAYRSTFSKSPGLRRQWAQHIAFLGSAILIVPFLEQIAASNLLSGIAVAVLGAAAVALFHWRKMLRAIFFLPLMYVAGLVAIRFRLSHDDAGFAIAMVAFVFLFGAWLLTNAFWSPYADDLAEDEALTEEAR